MYRAWNHKTCLVGSSLVQFPKPSSLLYKACYKWGGPSNQTAKTEAPRHNKRDTIKIPILNGLTLSAKGLYFAALSGNGGNTKVIFLSG